MSKNHIGVILATSAYFLAACQNATATPVSFDKFTVIGNDWTAERVGLNDFILVDTRNDLISSWKRHEFLDNVLQQLQDDEHCVFIDQQVETNGSKRVIVKDPNCLKQMLDSD